MASCGFAYLSGDRVDQVQTIRPMSSVWLWEVVLDITTNSAPQNICSLFTSTQDIHQYNTRSASSGNYMYYINHSRLNHHKNSFSIVGAKIWNSIPESYRRLPKHIFKKKMQALLFVTLETLDSYADTSTLISEIRKTS